MSADNMSIDVDDDVRFYLAAGGEDAIVRASPFRCLDIARDLTRIVRDDTRIVMIAPGQIRWEWDPILARFDARRAG